MDTNQRKVHLHLFMLHVPQKHIEAHRFLVLPHLEEDVGEPLQHGLCLLQIRRGPQVQIMLRCFHSIVDKDCVDDIQNGEHRDDDEHQEDNDVARPNLHQQPANVPPIHATGDGHEEREHRHGQRTKEHQDFFHVGVWILRIGHMRRHGTGKDHRETEHHEKQAQHPTNEHRPATGKRQGHSVKLVEKRKETYKAKHAHGPQHPRETQHPDVA
mmetsp:Transcript_2483/g.7320  ORF Transcript_2483/g.7320 Transcript_2483/m.7320 type:complete len:213 (-) Transcript_2483:1217-1855(-)